MKNEIHYTRETYWRRMARHLDELADEGGLRRQLLPGQAARQLELLAAIERDVRGLRRTLKYVIKREQEQASNASKEETTSSFEDGKASGPPTSATAPRGESVEGEVVG